MKFSRIAGVLTLLAMMSILAAGQDFSCLARKLQNGSSQSELTAAATGAVPPTPACELRESARVGMLKALSFVPQPPVAVVAVSNETCSVVRAQTLEATPLASVRSQSPSDAQSELRI